MSWRLARQQLPEPCLVASRRRKLHGCFSINIHSVYDFGRRFMITVYPGLKHFSQASYDAMVRSLDLSHISCTCGKEGALHFNGSYRRRIKTKTDTYLLRVQRTRCRSCGATHAIFPSDIIPYNQILLDEQIAIIRNHESGDGNRDLLNANPDIDENNVAAVIRRYDKVWMEENSDITADGSSQDSIVRKSFERTERQFLQIKKTPNIFVDRTT